MKPEAYSRVLGHAHGVRLLARHIAGAELDEAIDALTAADTEGAILDPTLYRDRHQAMREDEATLRAVRVLASLGTDESLVGEGTASEPLSASCRLASAPANGSQRGTVAPSPGETVAFTPAVAGERRGPAASQGGRP